MNPKQCLLVFSYVFEDMCICMCIYVVCVFSLCVYVFENGQGDLEMVWMKRSVGIHHAKCQVGIMHNSGLDEKRAHHAKCQVG